MANSKELAEQAFSLLSDALRDSEERVAELDAELRKKRAPKHKLEEQASVLNHRLESAEAEREKWRQEAGHLDELLENERAKIAQLKKKLDVAESGPDKVSKKEVNFWRQRAEEFDEEIARYKERLAAVRKELREKTAEADKAAEEELQSDINLSAALETTQKELDSLRERVQERDGRIAKVSAELEKTRAALAGVEQQLGEREAAGAEQDAARQQQKEQHEQALNDLRAEHEQAVNDLRSEHDSAVSDLRRHSEEALGDLREQLDKRNAELERLNSVLAEQRETRPGLEREIDDLRKAKHSLEEQLRESDGKANAARTEQTNLIETLNNLVSQRDEKIAGLEQALADASRAKAAAEEKIAGLEEQLAEERECTVDVRQLANERREEIEQLVEKLEEMEERYEEAKWKLGKAAHFEKLVVRRKKLIGSLIAEIRAKVKANTALKAGIDGLRTFKATSERNQQKLLARADRLSDELAEARETIVVQQKETVERTELEQAQTRAAELEARVKTQVELIDSLEDELKSLKLAGRPANGDPDTREIEALRAKLDDQVEEIGRKNDAIQALEADIDGLQKKLGKLRGSESETMRLKVVQEQDHNTIVELEEEIESLKEQLAEAPAAGSPEGKAGEKDREIQLLRERLQEQDKEIGRLSEAVSGWQKKYEFLAAEAPAAYQADATK